MEGQAEKHAGARVYIIVWLCLLVLTAATIKAAEMQMGEWSMLANLLIASTKAGLVLWFFMHLRQERKLFKLLFFVPIVTITIIIGLTFFDVWFRR